MKPAKSGTKHFSKISLQIGFFWTNSLLFWQFKHFLVSENNWFYQQKIIVSKKPYQLKTDLRYAKKNKMKTSNRVQNKDHAIVLSVMS